MFAIVMAMAAAVALPSTIMLAITLLALMDQNPTPGQVRVGSATLALSVLSWTTLLVGCVYHWAAK